MSCPAFLYDSLNRYLAGPRRPRPAKLWLLGAGLLLQGGKGDSVAQRERATLPLEFGLESFFPVW